MAMAVEAGHPLPRSDEPGRVGAAVAAVGVHLLFVALLFFGVNWQQRQPEAVVVDLWSNLPPAPAVKAPEPAPAPRAEVKPPPPPEPAPRVEPKPEPKPAPKPEPRAEPKPAPKPDIALEREKEEKARRAKEEQEKALAKKREEAERAEAKRRENEERARLAAIEADRVAKEAEKVRLAREQQDAMRRLQDQQAAAQASMKAEYIGKIRAKIRRYIVLPPDVIGNPQVEYDVVVLPTGDVLGVKLKKGSQHAAYDAAVERAIMRAQPLPVPSDPSLFRDFRELNLQFRPNE